jgi:hypothetical protein
MFKLALSLLFSLALLLPAAPAAADSLGFEQRVVEIVNQKRASAGLSPVVSSNTLATSARAYADQMARQGFFGHAAPDGSTFVSRDEAAGYVDWTFLGENLAGGQPDPQNVVDAWMNSPGHRDNILSANARELGVGYVYRAGSKYGHYWVQEFGTRRASPPQILGYVGKGQPSASADSASPVPVVDPASPPSSLRAPFDSLDTLGAPLSKVVRDQISGRWVQYYQRAVLEWHPENSPDFRVQRRLIGDALYPGADAPVGVADAPSGEAAYYPLSAGAPTGLGHFVADFTRSGTPVYFKQFFDSHGGVGALGYPKEEPRLRDGFWTQRFQAGTLRYHPEFDRDGVVPGTDTPLRAYRVQLDLLGEIAYASSGLR